jgi:hypothetical protein
MKINFNAIENSDRVCRKTFTSFRQKQKIDDSE